MKADVVVALKGGLGNQLFQWAFGEALAERGARVSYDTGLFTGNVTFELGPMVDESRLVHRPTTVRRALRKAHLPVGLSPWRDVHENGFRFDPVLVDGLRGRSLVEGYWQSPRYFADIESTVRARVLSWASDELTDEGRALRASITSASGTCSVHVRRGDYLTNPTARDFHGVLDVDYFRRAMDEARLNGARRFSVFTNDHAWVAEHLAGPDVQAVPWSVSRSPVGEIGLMAACEHHVVANSSFSWWGAWLGEPAGHTFAPDPWFEGDRLDTRDLVPAAWHRIPAGNDTAGNEGARA